MVDLISRKLSVTVSVQKNLLWLFLEKFSEEFALPSGDDLGRTFSIIRSASYVDDPRTPERELVTVELAPEEEERFHEFCRTFAQTYLLHLIV